MDLALAVTLEQHDPLELDCSAVTVVAGLRLWAVASASASEQKMDLLSQRLEKLLVLQVKPILKSRSLEVQIFQTVSTRFHLQRVYQARQSFHFLILKKSPVLKKLFLKGTMGTLSSNQNFAVLTLHLAGKSLEKKMALKHTFLTMATSQQRTLTPVTIHLTELI